jgi:hypothetical protein
MHSYLGARSHPISPRGSRKKTPVKHIVVAILLNHGVCISMQVLDFSSG